MLQLKDDMEKRGLWAIYKERMKLPPIVAEMEFHGATGSISGAAVMRREFGEKSEALKNECLAIAGRLGYDLAMPKGAAPNGSLSESYGPPTARPAPQCSTDRRQHGSPDFRHPGLWWIQRVPLGPHGRG